MLRVLEEADVDVLGRLADASHLALLVRVGGAEGPLAIYKPVLGERPLWDFPEGTLAGRSPSASTQNFAAATGRGTLEAARGPDHLSRNGVALTGERDIFGAPVSTTNLATAEVSGNTWSGVLPSSAATAFGPAIWRRPLPSALII